MLKHDLCAHTLCVHMCMFGYVCKHVCVSYGSKYIHMCIWCMFMCLCVNMWMSLCMNVLEETLSLYTHVEMSMHVSHTCSCDVCVYVYACIISINIYMCEHEVCDTHCTCM